MPIILRFVVMGVLAFLLGSTVTPLLWQPVLVQQSKEILSPYTMISTAVLIAAGGYAAGQWRKPRR